MDAAFMLLGRHERGIHVVSAAGWGRRLDLTNHNRVLRAQRCHGGAGFRMRDDGSAGFRMQGRELGG
jgi:hypothetical protein